MDEQKYKGDGGFWLANRVIDEAVSFNFNRRTNMRKDNIKKPTADHESGFAPDRWLQSMPLEEVLSMPNNKNGRIEGLLKKKAEGSNVKLVGKYPCVEEFLLMNGRTFGKRIQLPEGVQKGKRGRCHYNSFFTVLGNKVGLFYVEGVMHSFRQPGVLIPHAWVTNKKFEVIDPTLTFRDDTEYFGVILNVKYINNLCLKRGGSNTLFFLDSEDGYPLMKDSKKEWGVNLK